MDSFLEMYETCREILAVPTVGRDLAFSFNNRINASFGVSHGVSLLKNRYQLLAFVDQPNYTLSGCFDTRGLFCANLARQWPDSGVSAVVLSKCVANVAGVNTKAAFIDASVAKKDERYAVTLHAKRQDHEKVLLAATATFAATDRWTLGAQVQADREKSENACAVAARYAGPLGSIVATATSTGVVSAKASRRVCHYDKPGEDNVGLAAEITYDSKTGRSQTYAGWSFFMPHTKSIVRAAINGSGRCKASVEERLNQSTMLKLSAECDHASSDFRFGVGVQVGPKPPARASAVQAAPAYDPLKVQRWRSWL
jgi:hypothetical protein